MAAANALRNYMLSKRGTTPGYPATAAFSCASQGDWQYYYSKVECDTTASTTISFISLDGDWNGWKLTEVPSALALFTNLKMLSLNSHEILAPLPDWLFTNNPSLRSLTLTRLYNAGTNAGRSLPAAIGGLTALTWLNLLQSVTGGTIPDYSSLKSLVSLELQSNGLTGSIPSYIGLLSQLRYNMNVGSNSLSGSIPSSLGLLTKINEPGTVFDISSNRVRVRRR